LSEYINNTGGITLSVGTDAYAISADADTFKSMVGRLTDGATYSYKVIFNDVADGTDFEVGSGLWVDATSTLTRVTIDNSSNSDNAVVWGAGTKLLQIVEDSAMAKDMEKMVEGSTKIVSHKYSVMRKIEYVFRRCNR